MTRSAHRDSETASPKRYETPITLVVRYTPLQHVVSFFLSQREGTKDVPIADLSSHSIVACKHEETTEKLVHLVCLYARRCCCSWGGRGCGAAYGTNCFWSRIEKRTDAHVQ